MGTRTKFAATLILALASLACATEEEGESTIAAASVEEIPVSTDSEEARNLYHQAQELLDNGRAIEANAVFRRAVEADADFARGYLGIANSANSTTEFKQNLDRARGYAEDASEGERLLIDINLAFLDNNLEGALALARQLVEKYPSSPRARLSLGGAYGALDRNEEARAAMLEAIELDPELAAAHTTLGFNYLFSEPKDFDAAVRHFRHAVELNPDEPQAHVNLGDARRGSQDLEAARDAYGRAALLDPDNSKGVYSLAMLKKGHVNSFLGAYEQARADYDSALAVAKPQQHSTYAVYRAFTWVHEGEPQTAIEELQTIIDRAPEVTPADQVRGARIFALTQVAQIALHHGMVDAADRAIERRNRLALENAREVGSPEFTRGQQAGAVYWEGRLAAVKGEYEMARIKAEENARLLEPDANPRKLEPYHDLLGLVALRQGRYEDAIEHYEKANPNVLYNEFNLALAHEGAGNDAKAQQLFQKVYENNFNSVGYALVRDEAHAKMRQTTS